MDGRTVRVRLRPSPFVSVPPRSLRSVGRTFFFALPPLKRLQKSQTWWSVNSGVAMPLGDKMAFASTCHPLNSSVKW
jgi:hypothetical protein